MNNSEEALNALLLDPLGFNPGTSFGYSNQNFTMHAIIIEKVTSLTYENFIRREILKPLSMKDTYFWDEVTKFKNVAEKHQDFADSLTKRNWGYIGSGGIYPTGSDLYKFMKAVILNQLISKGDTALLYNEYYRTTAGLSIGYGWFISDSTEWGSKEIWTRGSESWGHNAVIRWFPARKTVNDGYFDFEPIRK